MPLRSSFDPRHESVWTLPPLPGRAERRCEESSLTTFTTGKVGGKHLLGTLERRDWRIDGGPWQRAETFKPLHAKPFKYPDDIPITNKTRAEEHAEYMKSDEWYKEFAFAHVQPHIERKPSLWESHWKREAWEFNAPYANKPLETQAEAAVRHAGWYGKARRAWRVQRAKDFFRRCCCQPPRAGEKPRPAPLPPELQEHMDLRDRWVRHFETLFANFRAHEVYRGSYVEPVFREEWEDAHLRGYISGEPFIPEGGIGRYGKPVGDDVAIDWEPDLIEMRPPVPEPGRLTAIRSDADLAGFEEAPVFSVRIGPSPSARRPFRPAPAPVPAATPPAAPADMDSDDGDRGEAPAGEQPRGWVKIVRSDADLAGFEDAPVLSVHIRPGRPTEVRRVADRRDADIPPPIPTRRRPPMAVPIDRPSVASARRTTPRTG